MANNKVQLANGTVLIDITDTTANASDVLSGEYFYNASGVKTEGSLTMPSTYTVTKTLTNVTTNNNDTEVLVGNSFYMDLILTSGYTINSIVVTMGGIDVTEQVFKAGVGSKTITQNGVYDAEDDWLEGYSEVTVNVPNTYTLSDEGKVVSGGTLVSQTSDTVTQNGTVDTTLINSLTVNVSGGSVNNIILPGANSTITVSSRVQPVYFVQGYKNRRCILNTSGDHSMWMAYSTKDYATVSGLYPLPIPSGSTKVNISATGPAEVIYMTYSWNGSYYVKVDDSNWVSLPITNGVISSSAAYIGISFRVNSSNANFTEANQPTNVSVTFE